MIRRVTDARDAAVAPYRGIGDPAALERDGLFVAEGRLIVERLLSLPDIRVHSIAVTQAAAGAMAPLLESLTDVPVLRLRSTGARGRDRLRLPSRLSGAGAPAGDGAPAGCVRRRVAADRAGRGRESRQRRRPVPRGAGAGRRRGAARSDERRSAVSKGDPHVDGGVASRAVHARRSLALTRSTS